MIARFDGKVTIVTTGGGIAADLSRTVSGVKHAIRAMQASQRKGTIIIDSSSLVDFYAKRRSLRQHFGDLLAQAPDRRARIIATAESPDTERRHDEIPLAVEHTDRPLDRATPRARRIAPVHLDLHHVPSHRAARRGLRSKHPRTS
jgi:hypothetical protein